MTYRPKTILALFALAILAFSIAASCGGCAPVAVHALGNIPLVGSEVDQGLAYLASADAAIDAARSHADAVGQSALALAKQANTSATTKLKQVGGTLGKVQSDFNAQEKQIQPLKDRVKQLTTSTWYRFGQLLNWCFWALITCVVIHLVCAVAKIIILWISPLNPVALLIGRICGWIAKWINPLAWGIALLAWFEQWHAVATAVTNTLSLPPDTLTEPPTPGQLKVLATPRKKDDPPLTRKLNTVQPMSPDAALVMVLAAIVLFAAGCTTTPEVYSGYWLEYWDVRGNHVMQAMPIVEGKTIIHLTGEGKAQDMTIITRASAPASSRDDVPSR